MSLNTLFKSHEIKNVGGIFVKPAPKKVKIITTEALHLIRKVYEMIISVGRCLKSKVVKKHISKNFGTCKGFCKNYILLTK